MLTWSDHHREEDGIYKKTLKRNNRLGAVLDYTTLGITGGHLKPGHNRKMEKTETEEGKGGGGHVHPLPTPRIWIVMRITKVSLNQYGIRKRLPTTTTFTLHIHDQPT